MTTDPGGAGSPVVVGIMLATRNATAAKNHTIFCDIKISSLLDHTTDLLWEMQEYMSS
jgi:hypothetical protein